ncbi:hypothetical protein SAMN05216558_1812 [Pseudomonas vancouverensis]|nr:hypothetical protein SAMN05216558_1812 [Pseudomonas vancouverensis]
MVAYRERGVAQSVVLIDLIKKIYLVVFRVFFIENALSVFFAPRLVIMKFVIEQVVVLRLGDIAFFAHDLPKQK